MASSLGGMEPGPERHLPHIKPAPPPSKLPPKSPSPNISPSRSPLLPLLPAATKAEQYGRLVFFDRRVLRRPQAHCRNALKTTENLESILSQLKECLSSLESSEEQVSLERLAAFADAFHQAIQISGVYAPLLKKIKAGYECHLGRVLGSEKGLSLAAVEGRLSSGGRASSGPELGPSPELLLLRRQVHTLERRGRALLQENQRLKRELSKEAELHRRVMQDLQTPVQDTLGLSTEADSISKQERSTSPHDYATRVEQLQLQLAEQREATVEVVGQRKGRVPLSVGHQLEQGLREGEIEIQKLCKRNEKLRKQIQEAEAHLAKLLKDMNTSKNVISKLWKGLQENIETVCVHH